MARRISRNLIARVDMLVVLDDSLATASKELSKLEIECLDDVLLSHAKLHHYIGANKRTALTLANELKEKLSSRALQALATISTQSNDLSGLLKLSAYFAVIRRSELAGCHIESGDQYKKWLCDLVFASKWFSNPTRLIGENLTDTKIFIAASIDFALTNKIESSNIKIHSDMSGGSGQAHEMIEVRINEAIAPVLCLIDSDKLTPDGAQSSSVSKCHSKIDEMRGVSHFEALKERELENVLPKPLIEGAIARLNPSRDRDEIMQRSGILNSIRENTPLVYSHVDIKNGTCMAWAREKKVDKFFGGCKIIAPCDCKKDCEGLIAPPLFDDVLGKTADFIENTSPQRLFQTLKNVPRQSWLEIGKTVFSFGFSNNVRCT